MSTGEYLQQGENRNFQIALELAQLVLSQPAASPRLGSNFQESYGRPISNLLRGNLDKVLLGYRVDVSDMGVTLTPRGLGWEYKDIITERAAIGMIRSVRRQRQTGWPVETTLTEYQQAMLHTAEGEIPVLPHGSKPVRSPLGRERYKPTIWHGTNVSPYNNPADSLYVLESTSPSSDGRGPHTTVEAITFSAHDVVGDADWSVPFTTEPTASERQRSIGALVERLTFMADAGASQ
jgi:hypothetical protein